MSNTWKKIIGTQEQEFRIGLQGPKLVKGVAGLEVQDKTGALTDIKANTFSGNGAALTNLTGSAVVGQVADAASADVALSVDAANIVGTVASASVAYSVDGANVVGQVSDAASADVALSVAGANVSGQVADAASADVALSVAGANVSGQVADAASADVALSVAGANVSGEVAFAATANAVAGANVSGQVANAASADVALSVAGANVSGIVALATEAYSVAGANVSGEVAFAATANAVAGANVSGVVALATEAYSVAGANVSGQVANAASADVALSVAGANVSGQVADAASADVALSVAGANVTGTVSSASVAYSVDSANIVGQVANAASADVALSVAGANVSGNVAGALTAYALSTDAANVVITGGTAGQFLQTAANGAVSWATVDASGIQNGTSSVVIPVTDGNVITTVGGTQIVTISAGGLEMTGNLDITGNINVTGNLNYQNVTDMVVGDPLIYIGANNAADLFDLGLVASYTNGTEFHTGLARDHTDGTWKFYDNVSTEPTTVIDFADGTLADVALRDLTVRDITASGSGAFDSLQIDGLTDTNTLRVGNGADLGDVSTLTIDGGNAGEVLTTDGLGVVSWTALPSTASSVKSVLVEFQYNTSSAGSFTVPAGSVIDSIVLIVDTAFNGTATATIGNSTSVDCYALATDTDLSVADRYELPQTLAGLSADDSIIVTITGGGATVGQARAIAYYSTPV